MSDSSDIKDFTSLETWQVAHQVVLETYKIAKKMPSEERFVLAQHITKTAISITSNIAESYGRFYAEDKKRFLQIALGSLYELQNQLILTKDLDYISQEEFKAVNKKLGSANLLLRGLIKSTKNMNRVAKQ